MKNKNIVGLVVAASVISTNAWATQGSHLVGYGAKSQSMGGASVAYPRDAIAAAYNPAGMALVGNRVDADVQIIYAGADLELGSSDNKHKGSIVVPIPEFGADYQLTPNVTIGVSTYASGVGFKYDDPVLPVPGLRRARGALSQVDIIPTITYKFENGLAIGGSLVYGIQKFNLQGLPGPFPGGQNEDFGTEKAYGYSWKVGALWNFDNGFAVGASYKPKMEMTKLSGYKDKLLSTTVGSIDSPESYSLGIKQKFNDDWTAALDYKHVSWSNVDAFSEAFGWHDQDIVKLGVEYNFSNDWQFRAGVSHGRLHTTG
ncbi:OmpP1/FadL family transporter [Pseudomonas asplenii]|uniref:OmpP1/FadL family transporter n=1 Tax=Pseudomonas asplenii TaxID=53407 RepID=UPI0037CB2E0B